MPFAMPRISLELGLAIGGIILTILLVVLDKAGRLKGGLLLWLLVAAALLTLPLALGNSVVIDGASAWNGKLVNFVTGTREGQTIVVVGGQITNPQGPPSGT